MKRTSTLLLFVAVFTFGSARAEAAIQLRLRVEPVSQLPAVEPTLRVEAVNTGSDPAELPQRVALQVTPPGNRTPFVAFSGMRGEDRVSWFDADGSVLPIVLGPGEARDVSFWAGPESPTWFAADSRLLSPGAYRLQLVADPKLDSDSLEALDRAIDQPDLASPIVSNEVTYTVETPTDEDAAVWELIKQLPSPTLWRDALGSQIWASHPDSRYAAFSLRVKNPADPQVGIAAREAALAKGPSRSWADWWRLGIAQKEVQRSSRFISNRDAEGALAAIERAKVIVTQLVTDSENPSIRNAAQQILSSEIMTRDQLTDYIRRLNGEIREVRPYVACVETVDGGKHRFWFGFDNTGMDAITIPIGKDNRFTPPPFDRGQPAIFPSAGAVLGLQIVTDEPALTWHLQKFNVHASVAETQPCPDDLLERFAYKPPQRN